MSTVYVQPVNNNNNNNKWFLFLIVPQITRQSTFTETLSYFFFGEHLCLHAKLCKYIKYSGDFCCMRQESTSILTSTYIHQNMWSNLKRPNLHLLLCRTSPIVCTWHNLHLFTLLYLLTLGCLPLQGFLEALLMPRLLGVVALRKCVLKKYKTTKQKRQ